MRAQNDGSDSDCLERSSDIDAQENIEIDRPSQLTNNPKDFLKADSQKDSQSVFEASIRSKATPLQQNSKFINIQNNRESNIPSHPDSDEVDDEPLMGRRRDSKTEQRLAGRALQREDKKIEVKQHESPSSRVDSEFERDEALECDDIDDLIKDAANTE